MVDGVTMLDDLLSFASTWAIGFNIWPQLVPQATEYTFEFFHKVLLKHEKYQGLNEELERKWAVNELMLPVVIGALKTWGSNPEAGTVALKNPSNNT